MKALAQDEIYWFARDIARRISIFASVISLSIAYVYSFDVAWVADREYGGDSLLGPTLFSVGLFGGVLVFFAGLEAFERGSNLNTVGVLAALLASIIGIVVGTHGLIWSTVEVQKGEIRLYATGEITRTTGDKIPRGFFVIQSIPLTFPTTSIVTLKRSTEHAVVSERLDVTLEVNQEQVLTYLSALPKPINLATIKKVLQESIDKEVENSVTALPWTEVGVKIKGEKLLSHLEVTATTHSAEKKK